MKLSSVSVLSPVPSLLQIYIMKMIIIQYASAANYNIIFAADIVPKSGALLESSTANGFQFQMDETIFNEALLEIQQRFSNCTVLSPDRGSGMQKYEVTYFSNTIDPCIPAGPNGVQPRVVTLNLSRISAYGRTFYVRKNDSDGSEYTLFNLMTLEEYLEENDK